MPKTVTQIAEELKNLIDSYWREIEDGRDDEFMKEMRTLLTTWLSEGIEEDESTLTDGELYDRKASCRNDFRHELHQSFEINQSSSNPAESGIEEK